MKSDGKDNDDSDNYENDSDMRLMNYDDFFLFIIDWWLWWFHFLLFSINPTKLGMQGGFTFLSLKNPRICYRRGILFQISLLLFSTWREYFYSQSTKSLKVPLLLQNLGWKFCLTPLPTSCSNSERKLLGGAKIPPPLQGELGYNILL